MGSVVAVVVVRRSLFVRRSLLLSLPLSLPVVSPLPLSLPFDFRIALHSTACATSSHIISSHPSYLTLSFGYLLAGCCLLLLTRSPTPLLAHSITPSYCFLFRGKSKTSNIFHICVQLGAPPPRCRAKATHSASASVLLLAGVLERRDSASLLRVATARPRASPS